MSSRKKSKDTKAVKGSSSKIERPLSKSVPTRATKKPIKTKRVIIETDSESESSSDSSSSSESEITSESSSSSTSSESEEEIIIPKSKSKSSSKRKEVQSKVKVVPNVPKPKRKESKDKDNTEVVSKVIDNTEVVENLRAINRTLESIGDIGEALRDISIALNSITQQLAIIGSHEQEKEDSQVNTPTNSNHSRTQSIEDNKLLTHEEEVPEVVIHGVSTVDISNSRTNMDGSTVHPEDNYQEHNSSDNVHEEEIPEVFE